MSNDETRLFFPFRKMHGLGNDFVVVDARSMGFNPSAAQMARLCDRHFGIGCDQLIVLRPPRAEGADVFMAIHNPDGSEAGACGNATRCVAGLLMDERESGAVTIETISGLLPAKRAENGHITVNMGPARFDWAEIPLAHETDTLALPLGIEGLPAPVAMSMGNPHAVFFVPSLNDFPVGTFGPLVESHNLFPQRTNVEFVEVLSRTHLRMRVWERGAGITLACGSGACATLVAAVRRGLSERQATITLDGGDLTVEWLPDGHVLMTGPWSESFTGTWSA